METHGSGLVPDNERTGRIRPLFPTWADANPAVLPLTMGAGPITLDGLNFRQVLAVAIVGPVISFGLADVVSITGRQSGAPGMTPSRAARPARQPAARRADPDRPPGPEGGECRHRHLRHARRAGSALRHRAQRHPDHGAPARLRGKQGPGGGPALHPCEMALRPVRRHPSRAPRTGPGGHGRRLVRVRAPAAARGRGSGGRFRGDEPLHF
ncbi:cytosine permease [Streptomyces sp. NPDC015032]|uniref:cytosine permease n=1 Tax=Streptomyces sp. NPDC015032 TaxID=3364937 RepID=UPI0036F7C010